MDKGFCKHIGCERTDCENCLAKKYEDYVEEMLFKALKNLARMQKYEEVGKGNRVDPWPTAKAQLANTRLIAAAPDLYKAAKGVLESLDMVRDVKGIIVGGADELRKAVAKVEGKQEKLHTDNERRDEQ